MKEPSLSEVQYRLATEADFPSLVELYTKLHCYFYQVGYHLPSPDNVGELWLDSFRRTLGRFSRVDVAEVEGCIVGFVLGRLKRLPTYMGGVLAGEISDLWVEPEARRFGIGNELVRRLLRWLKEQGVHSVEVQVLRDNEPSWKLFERLGFEFELRVGRLMWDRYHEQAA